MPGDPKEAVEVALTEAWEAAEYCKRLLDQNNISTAAVWAGNAQAWAAIAAATIARSG